MELRRKTDFPHAHIVTGLFYYLSVITLFTMIIVGIYWQVSKDPNTFTLTESATVSRENDRSFFVNLNYCTPKSINLNITRHYVDVANDVYYTVPDGMYKTAVGCSKTKLQGHTGRLEPGKYEYRIHGSYDINPLRSEQKLLAVVKVTVE